MQPWSKEVFAKNLKWYIEKSGKTQKEVAEVVGVTGPTMNEWVKGKKFPRIDKIDILADYFGILKSDLIEDKIDDEMRKDNDSITDIVVRLRMDEDFRQLVESLSKLDEGKIKGVKDMLQAFNK